MAICCDAALFLEYLAIRLVQVDVNPVAFSNWRHWRLSTPREYSARQCAQ
jgi:hypothetical protein